jgi:hypothetical protein
VIIIEYPNYPRKILLSKKRMTKYFVKGKNEPKTKKYQTQDYRYKRFKDGKEYLVDKDNKPVIANPRACGTPKYQIISGQDVWAQTLYYQLRCKISQELHKFFKEKIKDLPVITFYPLKIEMEIHDTVKFKNSYWDVDNRALIYNKTFMDTLTECGKIIDDKNIYVPSPPSPHFVPIEEGETPKLVYIIKQTDDRRMLNFYKNLNF